MTTALSLTVAAVLLIFGAVDSGTALAQTSPSQGPSKNATAAEPVGLHDFDFIYGKRRMPNHRLTKRLAGSHEWVDFITVMRLVHCPGASATLTSGRRATGKTLSE